MNLADGTIMNIEGADEIAAELSARVTETMEKAPLNPETVINACDRLINSFDEKKYVRLMGEMGIDGQTASGNIIKIRDTFNSAYLKARLERELGGYGIQDYVPWDRQIAVSEMRSPLGCILHISAGNVDGLPAFSIIESLLAGNVSILKLPEEDNGISVLILHDLVTIEPRLSEYIYVFDYSSRDEKSIKRLIDAADAVAVWGSDETVRAMRKLVPPNVKLIEWGHKLSFAYVTQKGITDDNLKGLAEHICETNQLLCSSCQGMYVDTEELDTVIGFCERFMPILEDTARRHYTSSDIAVAARVSLVLRYESLESLYAHRRIFRGKHSSIIAYGDSKLEPSIQHRNCWARPLPRSKAVKVLRPYKSTLQTVGILCSDDERAELYEMFAKTGAVRVSSARAMSEDYCGGAHDGMYPLRRYTKLVALDV